jgi:nucleotidyltransferase substrate binding protein (TIGR01987 family)
MQLNLSSLRKAVAALAQSIHVFEQYDDKSSELYDTLRSGVIQNFEVAYELSWKFMKRWLEMNISPDIVTGVSRKEFYRIAAQNGLIREVEPWWEFHACRNRTSHIYNLNAAEDVSLSATKFLPYAEQLLVDLEQKL